MSEGVQRVAVVTGANRGLGKAITRRLAEQGLYVVLTGRNEQAAREAAEDLAKDGLSVSAHQLDVTDPASVVRAMADTGFTGSTHLTGLVLWSDYPQSLLVCDGV
jgi:NAD(P)-dependent dehydrogenase (short-subunit alcohol dehydrogenase family)